MAHRRIRWGRWSAGLAVVGALAALFTPEQAPEVHAPRASAFVWDQGETWARLERQAVAAREAGCIPEAIEAGLAGLDSGLSGIEAGPLSPRDARFGALEAQVFEVAAQMAGCPERVEALIERTSRLRRAVESQRVAWSPNDRAARDTQYRLLYGSRMAVEELLLGTDFDAEAPELTVVADVPSEAPSVVMEGVRVHSGDILVSRGGAPTSAFIARGNDRPGNFSHVALLHVSEAGIPTVIESHIEVGVVASSANVYLADTKLRLAVLRVRPDHPRLLADPTLPHRAATRALEMARGEHVAYDFAMDFDDPSSQFCSEVAYAAYHAEGLDLWDGLSSMSGPGLTRWLATFGVRHFRTLGPSDLEYDAQVRTVAEWRDRETLFDDHIDNAILDALIERAEQGEEVGYDYSRLPLARLAKAFSLIKNWSGETGPIPEGMTATTGLRVEWLRQRHAGVRTEMERGISAYRQEHGRRPAYWTLVELARAGAAQGG